MATNYHRRWGSALAGLLVVATAGWLSLRPSRVPSEPLPAPPTPPPASTAVAAEVMQPGAAELTPDGLRIRPAGSTEQDTRGMVPHPITPQHERIFRENNLIGDLNGAMDALDGPGLRRLLAQYRDEYPEDSHVLQDGYELIASCLENLTPATRAAAQRYYDEQLDSGLRRYIRRHCLEAKSH